MRRFRKPSQGRATASNPASLHDLDVERNDKLSHYPNNAVFLEALAEVQALGVRISTDAHAGAVGYAVIGGRSNARWWLLPFSSARVFSSSLAMVQPMLPATRRIKQVAALLSRAGILQPFVRQRLYISGAPSIAGGFEGQARNFAYFTGTNGPHRKVAVQIMDVSGRLLGYAKVSGNPHVKKFIEYERDMLRRVGDLALCTAHVPNVLLSGDENGVFSLVTDTLKTPETRPQTVVKESHVAFLQELRAKTSMPGEKAHYAQDLEERLSLAIARLAPPWPERLRYGIKRLRGMEAALMEPSLVHGDFTPWNSFEVGDKLYVFDWEHAIGRAPACYDLIHFLLADPGVKRKALVHRVDMIVSNLAGVYRLSPAASHAHLLYYLCSRSLFLVETAPGGPRDVVTGWQEEPQQAALMDMLLASPPE